MTTATAVTLSMEDTYPNSTSATRPDYPTNKVTRRISGSRDTVAQDFSELPEQHSNTTGLLSQKDIGEQGEPEVSIPLVFPNSKKSEYQSVILQDWEGVVETVGDESFTARLRDLIVNERYPSETAKLPIEDISDDDQELLKVGAVFYLTVGRLKRPNGRQQRFGRIVFRRLPGWTFSTLQRAEKRAERFSRILVSKD